MPQDTKQDYKLDTNFSNIIQKPTAKDEVNSTQNPENDQRLTLSRENERALVQQLLHERFPLENGIFNARYDIDIKKLLRAAKDFYEERLDFETGFKVQLRRSRQGKKNQTSFSFLDFTLNFTKQ